MMTRRSRRAVKAGVALVAVLCVLTLLAVVAASLTASSRTDLALARNLEAAAQAEALADAGVYRAVLALLRPSTAEPWRADGTFYDWRFAGAEIRVSIQDDALAKIAPLLERVAD